MKLFVGARENGQQVRPLSWMHLTQVQPIIAYGRSALPGMMPEYGPHSHSPLGLCPKNKQKKVWDWRNNMGYTCLTHGTPSSLPNIKLTKKLNFFVAAILKGLCALSLICDTRDTTGVSSCLYGKCLNPFYLSAQKTEAGFICLFACLFGEGCVLAHIWWYWGGGEGMGDTPGSAHEKHVFQVSGPRNWNSIRLESRKETQKLMQLTELTSRNWNINWDGNHRKGITLSLFASQPVIQAL